MTGHQDAIDPNITDQDRGRGIFIAVTVFTILIIISTGGRLAIKIYYRVRTGLDDYLIGFALLMNLTGNAFEYACINQGLGRHVQFLSPEQRRNVRMITELNILFADLALWAVKISICFFLLSLIRDVHRRAVWIIYGLITTTTIAATAQAIFWSLQAVPLEKLWNPDVPGTVASAKMLVVTIATFTAINSLTDLFYAVSPIYFFGRMQMNLNRKLILLSLTGSGLAVFASSIVRVAYVTDFFDGDYSWALYRVWICTIVERNLAEVIADLPAVFPLLRGMRKKFQRLVSSYNGRAGDSKSSEGNIAIAGRIPPTIGSSSQRSHNLVNKLGPIGPYSAGDRFEYNDADDLEGQITLRDRPQAVPNSEGKILVETSIATQTRSVDKRAQEEQERARIWPLDGMEPNPDSSFQSPSPKSWEGTPRS